MSALMPILPYSALFVGALVIFAIIDLIWIGVIARNFYRNALGHLMSERTNWGAGVAFYVVYVTGLFFFALFPSFLTDSAFGATLLGGLYGFFTYATYDLTNYATLRDWPLRFVVVDMAWGTFLSATTAFLAFQIGQVLL